MPHALRARLLNRFLPDIRQIIQLPFHQQMLNGFCPAYHPRFLLFIHLDAYVFLPQFGRILQDISCEYARLNNCLESEKFALLAKKNTQYIQLMYHQYPDAQYFRAPKHPFFYRKPDALDNAFQRYVKHLNKPGTLAEKVAQITACIWFFDCLGKDYFIYTCTEDNPYLPWLYGYGDESSVRITNSVLETLAFEYEKEPCSIKKENLFKIIEQSLALERDIFCSAYTQEPVAQYTKFI